MCLIIFIWLNGCKLYLFYLSSSGRYLTTSWILVDLHHIVRRGRPVVRHCFTNICWFPGVHSCAIPHRRHQLSIGIPRPKEEPIEMPVNAVSVFFDLIGPVEVKAVLLLIIIAAVTDRVKRYLSKPQVHDTTNTGSEKDMWSSAGLLFIWIL